MKIAVITIPPMFATGMRFIAASPFLIIIALWRKTPLLFPTGQRFFQLAICLFYFSIPFSLMIYGEQYVNSGLAAIIFVSMPATVLVTSYLFLNEKTNLLQIGGLVLAIVSLMGILLSESEPSTEDTVWLGILALLLAVAIHSVIYALCKKRSCSVSVITFNALPCLMAGLLLCTGGLRANGTKTHAKRLW